MRRELKNSVFILTEKFVHRCGTNTKAHIFCGHEDEMQLWTGQLVTPLSCNCLSICMILTTDSAGMYIDHETAKQVFSNHVSVEKHDL